MALATVTAAAVTAGVLVALAGRARPEPDRASRPVPVAAPRAPKLPDGPLRYVLLGGGAFPESTEVSLAQDVALAQRVLRGPGAVLFAGGQGARAVRVEDPRMVGDTLLVELGQLFQPRVGRHSRYEVIDLTAQAADRAELGRVFGQALARGKEALTLYVAAHGEQGESARDNRVVLWGGDALTVADLDALHARHARPLRVVMASCYSGGFAELAFQHADPERGPAKPPRCGLFAGTWDRQTSGCDPNPDRAAQESYSLHLWHALQSQDRDGQLLPAAEIDLDADGKVGLLEAHTRARIASRSIDVPTTTSERYLREVVSETGGAGANSARVRAAGATQAEPELPEERAVITQLGAQLALADEAAVTVRLEALRADVEALDAELEEAEDELDRAYGALAARLLARWPVLDDAYHPEFLGTLQAERVEIGAALRDWPEAHAYRAAQTAVDALDARYWDLQIDEARVERLSRAHETLRLAARLQATGGAALRAYRDLLACERAPLP